MLLMLFNSLHKVKHTLWKLLFVNFRRTRNKDVFLAEYITLFSGNKLRINGLAGRHVVC
jgi:hypothetical protein